MFHVLRVVASAEGEVSGKQTLGRLGGFSESGRVVNHGGTAVLGVVRLVRPVFLLALGRGGVSACSGCGGDDGGMGFGLSGARACCVGFQSVSVLSLSLLGFVCFAFRRFLLV